MFGKQTSLLQVLGPDTCSIVVDKWVVILFADKCLNRIHRDQITLCLVFIRKETAPGSIERDGCHLGILTYKGFCPGLIGLSPYRGLVDRRTSQIKGTLVVSYRNFVGVL